MHSRVESITRSSKLSLRTTNSGATHRDGQRKKQDEQAFKRSYEAVVKKKGQADVLEITSKEVAPPPAEGVQQVKKHGDDSIGANIDLLT